VLVLGTDDLDFIPRFLFTGSRHRRNGPTDPLIPGLLAFSPLRYSRDLPGLTHLAACVRLARSVRGRGLRCRTYKVSTGVLTSFPFANTLQLGARLGPTNPSLTFIGKEPLPFRRRRFSLRSVLTIARILIPARFTHACGRAFAHAGRLPTPHLAVGCSIGCRFSPVHFQHPHP
jgi:hypothetical protein